MKKIAFVGNFEYHCGSSNVIREYIKTGKKIGVEIRISEFSNVDNTIRSKIRIAKKTWKPDLFAIVFESYPFLSEKNIDQIKSLVPRSKRIIIDPDAKYSPPIFFQKDKNHNSINSYKYWTKLYDSLSNVILQPTLMTKKKSKIHPFLYFGIKDKKIKPIKPKYDLIYVGNNWYRWKNIKWLINSIDSIRDTVKGVGIIGRYWDEEIMKNFEEATFSDPAFLKMKSINLEKSAPYGKVEIAMSKGVVNPILIRPILNHLELITPRMFETFYANTIPLIPFYFSHAKKLYGKEASQLTLPEKPSNKIKEIFNNRIKYSIIANKIKSRLLVNHSYKKRISELLKFI